MEDFIRNVKAGLRLAFGQKISLADFVISIPQLLLLLSITVGLSGLENYLSSDFDFSLTFIGVSWGIWLLILFCLIVICGKEKWQAFLVVVFASNLILSITQFQSVFQPSDESDWFDIFFFLSGLISVLLLVFGIYILYRCLRLVYKRQRLFCIVSSVVAIALMSALVLTYFYKDLFLYDYSEIEDYSDTPEISIEETYYNQARLLQSQLSKLIENNPEKRDLYLIGFASYAYQDVFKKEVRYVLDTIQQRFNGLVQSIQLINHEDTIGEIALANKPNLAQTLNVISERMDVENDVAMIYLTSHGSKKGVLSADFWPIEPESLNANQLREILDASNIQWRIIFVSACYSGTFIEPLKTDYSLIITASEKHKTSFGCDNERELTYFAEAYFKEALPKSDSLLLAFDAAKVWVTEKEISEEKEPSEPQIFIGSEMQNYLKQFENQFSD